MKNIKAIIFDFDGTLANTLPICYYAFQNVFKEFDNKDLSSEEITGMFGPSETGIIRKNLSHINKEHAIELYYQNYGERHEQLVNHSKEIDDLLKFIKDRGIKLGIVTGKARRSLDISLESLHMDHLFDVIITGDDVDKPKPNPEGLLKALTLLGVESSEAIFIGDSDADIHAGVQAKVFTVGVHWLLEHQTSEFSIKPNLFFKSVTEFIDSLEVGVLYEL